ncbi:uncharacterized protein MYCGRDRAFT_39151 [Zymoseptoria tritici IPO323]|uniref:Enoyl reductase (ER) domain-containing protein n=1 Tax=Zymoseptoria tritici (strain CBS 115943 / IPO323) TaxID=336722 RepID=F9X630_ZYMTI|nr:uncharacterized protein MYCGRDRAFT_39151 [Zymoseptoria tritici IPO323]EGP89603.1 hypothetical protein MYCGRDRAFT_39151 [Zymoseptoria tritici IPO323]
MSEFTIPSRGIVSYSQHDWQLTDLLTRAPFPDEFLVEMIATGICHTDIAGFGGIYPRVYGHEGEPHQARSSSPSKFSVGDLVILSAAACHGHPAYCVQHSALTSQANTPTFVLASNKSKVIGGGFFGQLSFASPAPVKVSCAVNVTKMVRDAAELRLYAPLGCSIMTGAGTVTHVGRGEAGDVVAVVGLGGVGLAAIAAAKHRGVGTIIACDVVASRIELAKGFGSTAGLDTSQEGLGGKSLSEALKGVTQDGLGCTHILDTTPSVVVLEQCLEAVRNNGTVFQVGVKPVGAKLELDLLPHMVHGRKLVGVIEGDRDPIEALPELLQWCKDGTLPVEKMVTEFKVEEFEKARKVMEDGSVVKSVLVW